VTILGAHDPVSDHRFLGIQFAVGGEPSFVMHDVGVLAPLDSALCLRTLSLDKLGTLACQQGVRDRVPVERLKVRLVATTPPGIPPKR